MLFPFATTILHYTPPPYQNAPMELKFDDRGILRLGMTNPRLTFCQLVWLAVYARFNIHIL